MVQGIANPSALQSQIEGQVILRGDAQYEEARLTWNRLVDQYPAVIVLPTSSADVSAAVRYARQEGLQIAVQSTGHGVFKPADGALLVVTSHLRELSIDTAAQTARIGAGLKWGEVLEQTQKVGLAPLIGSSPTVGVVGYTLGGGYGWLGRKYGMAVDSVRSIELVDASGKVLNASAHENSDLFWGLRGGGGGAFGIVTMLEMQLFPVTEVYAGNLLYPAEMARDVMQHYRQWISQAPDELTSSVLLFNFPPFPQVPDPLRGKSFTIVRGCYAGDPQEGEALLRHWHDWQAPIMDMWGLMPFTQAAAISQDPVDPMPSKHTGAWLQGMSDATIDKLIGRAFVQGGPPPLVFVELRHAGGAVRRVSNDDNALSNREAELLLFVMSVTPSPEAYQSVSAYMSELLAEIEPDVTGGVYLNFLEGPEAQHKAAHGFSPEKLERLRALKKRCDPDGVLRSGYAF
jgi:UDP-N-acetylenolpyruvoylglucosamine reductase